MQTRSNKLILLTRLFRPTRLFIYCGSRIGSLNFKFLVFGEGMRSNECASSYLCTPRAIHTSTKFGVCPSLREIRLISCLSIMRSCELDL